MNEHLANLEARIGRLIDFIALTGGGSLTREARGRGFRAGAILKKGDTYMRLTRNGSKEVSVDMLKNPKAKAAPVGGTDTRWLMKKMKSSVDKGGFVVTAMPQWSGRGGSEVSDLRQTARLSSFYQKIGIGKNGPLMKSDLDQMKKDGVSLNERIRTAKSFRKSPYLIYPAGLARP